MREDRPIIELPRLVDVRPGAINDLAQTLDRLNLSGNGVMIVGDTTKNIAGNRIMEILENTNYCIEPHIVGVASLQAGKDAIEVIQSHKANYVLAVGGGTKIDIAKYASFQSRIPFISIPTVASHDGIASSRSSLTEGKNSKHSVQAHSPFAVIGDVDIVALAPRKYTISGCADIISNKTAVLDWQFSNRLTGEHISQYAMTLSELIATTMIEAKKIIASSHADGTYTVLKGLITSSISMCIAGSSRPASGAEHMISHKLDHILKEEGITPTSLHGEQCGVASIVSMYLHGGNWKEIRDTLKYIGAPSTAGELHVTDEQMIQAVVGARDIRPERFTILSNGITEQAAAKALVATGIISE